MSDSDERPWHGLAWLVLAAALLHNLEEGLTYATFHDRAQGRWYDRFYVDERVFVGALIVVSLAAIFAVGYGVVKDNPVLPGIAATVMLINVVAPHIPMAIISGGYSPGLVTALLLNLPICGLFLLRMRQARGTAGVAWWFLVAIGLIALLPLMRLVAGPG